MKLSHDTDTDTDTYTQIIKCQTCKPMLNPWRSSALGVHLICPTCLAESFDPYVTLADLTTPPTPLPLSRGWPLFAIIALITTSIVGMILCS